MTKITAGNPEVVNYGNERYAHGYEVGYQKSTSDARMRRIKKIGNQKARFLMFLHYLNVLKD
jgi:hypothetical protein